MHEVVPRAVSTAEMIDAIICSVHFSVSFLVIIHLLSVNFQLSTLNFDQFPRSNPPLSPLLVKVLVATSEDTPSRIAMALMVVVAFRVMASE